MQQRKSKVSGNKSDCPFMFLLLLCNHLVAQIRFQLFFIFNSSSAALNSAVMSQKQNNVVLNQIGEIMHGKVCLLKLCACPWIPMTKPHILKLKLSLYLVFSFSLLIISAFVWWPNYFRICDENKTIGYIFMLSLLLPLLLQSGILPLVCAKSKFSVILFNSFLHLIRRPWFQHGIFFPLLFGMQKTQRCLQETEARMSYLDYRKEMKSEFSQYFWFVIFCRGEKKICLFPAAMESGKQ